MVSMNIFPVGKGTRRRPGYLRPRRIDTSLLETCRLIYLETRLVHITYNEHVVRCYRDPQCVAPR
jgi:hypothetical protein